MKRIALLAALAAAMLMGGCARQEVAAQALVNIEAASRAEGDTTALMRWIRANALVGIEATTDEGMTEAEAKWLEAYQKGATR